VSNLKDELAQKPDSNDIVDNLKESNQKIVNSLEKNIGELKEEVRRLKALNRDLVLKVKTENEKYLQKATVAQQEKADLRDESFEKEKLLAEKTKAIVGLQQQEQQYLNEMEGLRKANEKHKNEVAGTKALKNQIDSLSKEITRNDEERVLHTKESGRDKNLIGQLKKDLKVAQAERDSSVNELNQIQENEEAIKGQFNELRKEKENLESEVEKSKTISMVSIGLLVLVILLSFLFR